MRFLIFFPWKFQSHLQFFVVVVVVLFFLKKFFFTYAKLQEFKLGLGLGSGRSLRVHQVNLY